MKETKIKYHDHGGYYNDGNSRYYSYDAELDLEKGMISIDRETTYGGQMAANGNYEKKENHEERKAIEFTSDTEDKIYETLKPLIDLRAKYPTLSTFRIFSQKHKYFINGRIAKAVKIGRESKSDYYGTDCSRHVFVLKKKGVVIRVIWYDNFNYERCAFKVEVTEIKRELDFEAAEKKLKALGKDYDDYVEFRKEIMSYKKNDGSAHDKRIKDLCYASIIKWDSVAEMIDLGNEAEAELARVQYEESVADKNREMIVPS